MTWQDELARRYPASTIAREISLPQIRAAAALGRNQPERAIVVLQPFRAVGFASFQSFYIRGEAYLRLRKSAEAATAFQTILDHRGWNPVSPVYPLAYLGLARAAVVAGDLARARKAYENLFAIWKNADADLPVLVDAREEYATLSAR